MAPSHFGMRLTLNMGTNHLMVLHAWHLHLFYDSLHDMMNNDEKAYRSIQKALAAFMQLVSVSFSRVTSTNRQNLLFISQLLAFHLLVTMTLLMEEILHHLGWC